MHMHDELYKDCVQKHEIDSPTEGKNSPICVYFIIEIKRNYGYYVFNMQNSALLK